MEGLAVSLVASVMTLIVFLPLLWDLSTNITELPFFGAVNGSLVWVALTDLYIYLVSTGTFRDLNTW